MNGGDRPHRVTPSKRRLDIWSEVNWGAQLADFKQMQYHQSILWMALVELLVEKGIVTREELRDFVRELDRKVAIMAVSKDGVKGMKVREPGNFTDLSGEREKKKK